MSLRLRLFLLFGGLVALLVLAQWWWVRVLTEDLSSELDEVAFSVGSSVVAFFKDQDSPLHREMIGCLGDPVEECEDLDVSHLIDIVGLGQDGDAVIAEGDVLIQQLRWSRPGQAGEDSPAPSTGHFGYSYQVEDLIATTGEPSSEEGAGLKRHVKIQIERQGDARYLFMGGPHMTRRIQIPEHGFEQKLERFSRRLVFGSMGFLALGLVLAAAVSHRVTTPLRRLSDAARRIGDGALGTRVADSGDGEVGEAIQAFNRMSGRLEELDARARELEARKHLGEIGEIARGLAHSLRNPLNALGLSVEELAARGSAAQGSAAQGTGLAESARRQIRRIDQSIRSFLVLASQSGGVSVAVDVGELIQDVALEALQDSRGKVRLELDLAADLPRLRAVEPELRAVLQALVVNAVEASPEGGRVTVRSAARGAGRLRIEIDDQGPGLAPEVRKRLFTPHLSTKANGSGMGLFLAHRIATNRYDGRLELVDLEGGGTRAVLELAARAASPGSEDEVDRTEEENGGE